MLAPREAGQVRSLAFAINRVKPCGQQHDPKATRTELQKMQNEKYPKLTKHPIAIGAQVSTRLLIESEKVISAYRGGSAIVLAVHLLSALPGPPTYLFRDWCLIMPGVQ